MSVRIEHTPSRPEHALSEVLLLGHRSRDEHVRIGTQSGNPLVAHSAPALDHGSVPTVASPVVDPVVEYNPSAQSCMDAADAKTVAAPRRSPRSRLHT